MEDQVTEWKVQWENGHLKTIAGFVNSDGGTMVIGMSDNGETVGVGNPQKLMKEVPDLIKNKLGITPSVEAVSEDGKTRVVITIEKGDRPVDLDGVFYKRVGSTTHQVTRDELQSWLLSRLNMSWTDLPAKMIKIEDLLQSAIDTFVKIGTIIGRMSPLAKESSNESLLKHYKLMDDNCLRISGAILFLEKPALSFPGAAVKIGAFDENHQLLRHDLIDCPVILQPDKVMDILLNKYILGTDAVEGLVRVTKYPYPVRALREGLMNALAHREYSSVAETTIRVYPDRTEIWNPGRLPLGWTGKDIFNKRESRPVNPTIAHVFYELKYIEQFGSGAAMMCDECRAMGLPLPECIAEGDMIKVIFRLPEKKDEGIPGIVIADTSELTKRESEIYLLISEGNVPTIANIAESIGVSYDTAKRTVKRLVEKGYLQRIGGNKFGKWIPVSKPK